MKRLLQKNNKIILFLSIIYIFLFRMMHLTLIQQILTGLVFIVFGTVVYRLDNKIIPPKE